MDVRLLCNILDGLCGSFILSHKLRQGVLHDVTLPLSWWTRLAGSLENLAQKESDWWHLCVDPLRALITSI